MSDPTKVVELAPTYVKEHYEDNHLVFGLPTGINIPGRFIDGTIHEMGITLRDAQSHYRRREKKLPAALNQQVTAIAGESKKPATLDSLAQQIKATKTLLEQKQKELDDSNKKSLSFDGTDPLDNAEEDHKKITKNRKSQKKKLKTWKLAYQAAYDAKYHQLAIELLNKRITQLELDRKEISERPQRPSTFTLAKASTAFPLVIASSPEAMALFDAGKAALQAAIRASVPALLPAVGHALGVATLMVYSPSLGDGERLGVSVPLAELKPGTDQLQELKNKAGRTIPLKVRITSGILGENSHIYMVPTDIQEASAEVRVRTASWNKKQGGYSFTSEGHGPITLLWTPSVKPGNSSTTLPGETDPKPPFPGLISVPSTPQILSFPNVGDVTFDDYIVIFPADSGLEPVYVMFKSPRDYPGVSEGDTPLASGRWMDPAKNQTGAPIPQQIADLLRGRTFASFDRFRETFWMKVASHPELSKQFNNTNLSDMRKGNSPKSQASEHYKSRIVYELHHVHPISKGGAVYDMSNIVIVTPKRHAEIHYGAKYEN